MAAETDTVECRTPTPGKAPTRIARRKFDAWRRAILAAVPADGEGVLFSDLPALVEAELPKHGRDELGSLLWHLTTVKLEMEVRGELRRLRGKGPQRLVRTL